MLLAGLQRETISRRSARIYGKSDNAAGQRALQRIANRHIGGMRPAKSHRHAEALRRTNRDIGAELAGRSKQRQAQEIGRNDRELTLRPCRHFEAGVPRPQEHERRLAFDERRPAFDDLTDGCNACHAAANKPFIHIQRPTTPPFSNQDFTPPK